MSAEPMIKSTPRPHLLVSPRSGQSGRTAIRNMVPLSTAAMLGFFLGLIEALGELTPASTLRLAEYGLAITVVVGLASTLGVRARHSERLAVSVLRAGLSGAVFCFVFEGLRLFLKIGRIGPALAWLIGAGIVASILALLPPARAPSEVTIPIPPPPSTKGAR